MLLLGTPSIVTVVINTIYPESTLVVFCTSEPAKTGRQQWCVLRASSAALTKPSLLDRNLSAQVTLLSGFRVRKTGVDELWQPFKA